nr:hypothetical protein BaRGS_012353 [Batillaria attramentaria]
MLRPSLTFLSLPDNAISDITTIQFPRFVPAQELEILDLRNNNISDLGVLTDMPKLITLYLAGNKLTSLHKLSFTRLPELGLLDLSRNWLRVLEPGTFKTVYLLIHLDLSHNYLDNFDRTVSPSPVYPEAGKFKVFLNDNRFSHPPFQKDNYDGKGLLVFAGDNPYECDCDMETYVDVLNSSDSVQELFADRADMLCQYPPVLSGRPVETILFTDVCPVVDGCPTNCTCGLSRSTSVVTVECSNYDLSQLPAHMPADYALHVNIHGEQDTNSHVKLSDVEYLRRVVGLNVSGVGLSYVPDLICEAMPHARVLDLSRNRLSRVPECLKTRSEDSPPLELHLAHNPWSCDCDNVWMQEWLAGVLDTSDDERAKVRVKDAAEVRCSSDTQPGELVADWDTDECFPFNYLPLVVTLGVVLSLTVVLGPILYVYRLKALVTIHAHLHVRPFTAAHHFNEADYDHEALVVHGEAESALTWMIDTLLPRLQKTGHRLCVPERDFFLGASIADSYSCAVNRSKAVVCLLNAETVQEEWWRYAFQIARAKNARQPHCRLLLVLLGSLVLEEKDMPEEVQNFLKTNTYLSADDKWFWKKLLYYLPDPPRQ